MQKLFTVVALIAALVACGSNEEQAVIELKDWTPPPETTTGVPDALPLTDTVAAPTADTGREPTVDATDARETIAGARIRVERTFTDLGNGSQEFFDYDARYRGGHGGVLVPVDWVPDVEGIDALAWSGDGTVMLYAIETGPGVHEIVVSGPNDDIVDRVDASPGTVVAVASTYSLAQTRIEGLDASGTVLGTCTVDDTYSSIVSCR